MANDCLRPPRLFTRKNKEDWFFSLEDTPLKIRVEKIQTSERKAQKDLTEVAFRLRSREKDRKRAEKAETFTLLGLRKPQSLAFLTGGRVAFPTAVYVIKVIASEFLIDLFFGQEMVDNNEEGMPQGYSNSLLPTTKGEPMVLS